MPADTNEHTIPSSRTAKYWRKRSPATVEPAARPAGADAEPDADRAAQRRLGITFWVCIGWILLVTAAAIAAPLLPISDPDQIGIGPRNSGPTWDQWFGTDGNGRDIFSRTIWGARVSLMVGFFSIVAGFLVGGTIGIVSGYRRGWIDLVLGFVTYVMLSFPTLVLFLLVIMLFGQGLWIVTGALSIVVIPSVARLARAITIAFAEREFVSAARLLGATNRRVMVREILPNVLIPMSALLLLGLGLTIVAEGGLAYLGLSVADGFSWGKMIQMGAGLRTLQTAPWVAFFPIGAMFLTVLSLNLAGDRLRQYFDVRELGIGSR
ncbi:MAG: ABC transporter permease [Acidimicrobiales bacterium]|nr:ABC transporter permease [Acidimicrobiales bacterium]